VKKFLDIPIVVRALDLCLML
jgi:hypothetical protein